MSQVRCEFVSAGLRASEALACVKDVHGRKHMIRVERDFLTAKGETYFLPIGIVNYDHRKMLVLVEFSHEPETGINRIWVKEDQLEQPVGAYA